MRVMTDETVHESGNTESQRNRTGFRRLRRLVSRGEPAPADEEQTVRSRAGRIRVRG